jgi:hypothetical protein
MTPTTRTGTEVAEAWIDWLDEPRRSDMAYSNAKGPAERCFAVGLASRTSHVSLYIPGTDEGGSLAEQARDRHPSTTMGKGCIDIRKPALIDDEVVADLARRSWDMVRTPEVPTAPG